MVETSANSWINVPYIRRRLSSQVNMTTGMECDIRILRLSLKSPAKSTMCHNWTDTRFHIAYYFDKTVYCIWMPHSPLFSHTDFKCVWIPTKSRISLTHRVPTVRESQGILKYHALTRPNIYALFSQLLSASGGFAPRSPPGLRPKHCSLVYIAVFYNGTKFSITFVYLVLFYWCRE